MRELFSILCDNQDGYLKYVKSSNDFNRKKKENVLFEHYKVTESEVGFVLTLGEVSAEISKEDVDSIKYEKWYRSTYVNISYKTYFINLLMAKEKEIIEKFS